MTTKMKTFCVILALLACSAPSWAAIAADYNFVDDPNIADWTILDTTSTGSASITATAGTGLKIEMTNGAQGRAQGIMSNETFALPLGGFILVDFYGTNHDSVSAPGLNAHHSSPMWLISKYDASADGFFPLWHNYIYVKGKDAYINDYFRWYAWGSTGYEFIGTGTQTWGNFKHVIVKIDAAEINFYIEDDFYENLTNPTPLKTVTTSNYITASELQSGLYVYILNARSTSWFTGTTANLYDGVKVTIADPASPDSCFEINALGYGLSSDVNRDCSVNLADFALITQDWLRCVDPEIPGCENPWD